MNGRPRTSTIALIGAFLGVLVLYVLVRPVPTSSGRFLDRRRRRIYRPTGDTR